MAQYDIAAATKRISPVQEMMQYGLQQDARKINALNIQKAEITMPYVEQLTQQQVRRNELAIEEAETKMPFLKSQLEQQKEMTDLQIDEMHRTAKASQRMTDFQEAFSSGKYSDAELRQAYPIEYGTQRLQEMQAQMAEFGVMRTELDIIASLPEDQRASAWRAKLADAPQEVQQALGEYSPEKLRDLRRNLSQAGTAAISQLVREIDYYQSLGTEEGDEMAALLMKSLERMGQQRAGTARERAALAMFPESDNPLFDYTDYYRIQKEESRIKGKLAAPHIGMDAEDAMMAGALTFADFRALATTDAGRAALEEEWENVVDATNIAMRNSEPRYDWYKDERARITGIPRMRVKSKPMTAEDEALVEQAKAAEQAEAGINRQSGYSESNPARPTTQAEFDALQSGDYYIDPGDGKAYRKP